MSWKRYFTPVTSGVSSPLPQTSKTKFTRTNYSSYLPDVYSGHPNRLERYAQYDTMDLDPEVNAAFDILSEFCTQTNEENGTPFQIFFKEQATSTEVKIVKKYLQQWCKLNNFHTRIFKIVRNTFKYGDCFFVRDPETQAWFYVDPSKVDKIIVNESDGKKPEQYVIRDLNVNFENLTVTQINPSNQNTTPGGTTYVTGGVHQRGMVGAYPQSSGSRFSINQNQWAINAEHVVHVSLSEGLDNNFPFGNSLMETIFKVYKQKELLEDAIIIYRVQRAPERRVFYIDVGNMPSHLAMSFVERVKNEVNQRRIPSLTGGGQSVVDSGFNPLAINEDYFFPQTCSALDTKIKLLDGRDLELQEIIQEYDQGKENWVYAINQDTHVIEPGKIVWAGKTRLNAQIVEVLLDNGEKIKVTPDHRFIMRDGSEVEAQHLKHGDSVMPLCLHDVTAGCHNFKNSYTYTHRVVSVTWFDQKEDTGDITVESASGAHNFALTAGVFIHNSEGRGSKIDVLPGGSNLGEIDDLLFFTQKMMRALRIPSSYLPTGVDDSQAIFSDGKVGTAYIQELRFNNYCIRLQNLMRDKFDSEFKQYLIKKGMNIDTNLFDIKFNNPQNFASSRQAEMDSARINSFGSVSTIPYLSKRFALKRYLGLSAEEIAENEKLWQEENGNGAGITSQNDLRDIGITPGGLSSDLSQFGQSDLGSEDMQAEVDTGAGLAPPGPTSTGPVPPGAGPTEI